jgi:hypothetical protein
MARTNVSERPIVTSGRIRAREMDHPGMTQLDHMLRSFAADPLVICADVVQVERGAEIPGEEDDDDMMFA